MQVNIKNFIDDVQCYQTVRALRWPGGIARPSCASTQVIRRGFKVFGLPYGAGSARIVVFHQRNSRSTWISSSVHNVRRRGKAWLPALIELLATEDPEIQYERMLIVWRLASEDEDGLYVS